MEKAVLHLVAGKINIFHVFQMALILKKAIASLLTEPNQPGDPWLIRNCAKVQIQGPFEHFYRAARYVCDSGR